MIRLLDDRVLVEVIKEPQMIGGIYLPDSATNEFSKGKVVTTGPGFRGRNEEVRAMTVKEGDTVLFRTKEGDTLKLDGSEFKLLYETELIGILDN